MDVIHSEPALHTMAPGNFTAAEGVDLRSFCPQSQAVSTGSEGQSPLVFSSIGYLTQLISSDSTQQRAVEPAREPANYNIFLLDAKALKDFRTRPMICNQANIRLRLRVFCFNEDFRIGSDLYARMHPSLGPLT